MSSDVQPIINTLNAPFWQGAAEDRLVLPFCMATHRAFWPPSAVSPFASRGKVEWRAASPDGMVAAVAVYRRAFHAAFAARMPYAIALVALDAGPRLHAHVADPDGSGGVRPGDLVRIAFHPILDGGPRVPTVQRIEGA